MYTNLNLFFRAEYLAFCKSKFSLRRWAYVIFFTIIYWLMWIVVAFGRFLDRLFFRGFLRQEIREFVRQMVDRVFGGSGGSLALRALSSRRSTPEERQAIRELRSRLEEDQ